MKLPHCTTGKRIRGVCGRVDKWNSAKTFTNYIELDIMRTRMLIENFI